MDQYEPYSRYGLMLWLYIKLTPYSNLQLKKKQNKYYLQLDFNEFDFEFTKNDFMATHLVIYKIWLLIYIYIYIWYDNEGFIKS